jgi:hypothetical protein
MIPAISQYLKIPMGMGFYYSVVWQYAWKPLFKKSKYEGEIGSSDMDDPFTQEEKIGYNAYLGSSDMDDPFTQEEKIGKVSKGKEPQEGKEREQPRQDNRSTQQMRNDYEDYMQERDERYIDPYQDYPTFYG